MRARWTVTMLFLGAALVPLAAYVATLNPTVPAGDSGELITAAATSGIAHPPGYPLYVLLGHAWAAIVGWGSVAWRLNLLSAACAAATAGLLALAIARVTGSTWAALLGAWTAAFSAPLWKYAVVAEVFAPNAMLASLALLAAAALDHEDRPPPPRPRAGTKAAPVDVADRAPATARSLRWPLALLGGLATLEVSLHHTLVLLVAPITMVASLMALGPEPMRRALAEPRPRRTGPHEPTASSRVRFSFWVPVAALVGLLPLVHLALAGHGTDRLIWGDPTSLRGLLRLVTRADYGSLRLDPLQSGMRADRSHVLLCLESLPRGLGWPGLALAALGAWTVARRHRPLGIALAGFALLQTFFFTRVGFPSTVAVLRGAVERFYILPNLVVAFLAGVGAAAALARLPRPKLAGPVLLAAAIAWPLAAHARLASQRNDRFTEHLGRAVLASLPRDAVVFIQGDLFHNALEYLTRVERMRPDVTVVDQELLTYDWYVRRLRRAHPDVIPPLGRADRIRMADGRTLEGRAIPRADGTTDLLLEDEDTSVPSASVGAIESAADPSRLFARTRATFHTGWLVPDALDRYSGLPGTRNLLWLDHLSGKRPAAFVGFKEGSWSLRYELIPIGLVAIAYPKRATPDFREQCRRNLEAMAATDLMSYFRAYDPWSFEATERAKLAEAAAHAMLLLCQREASGADSGAGARAGRERLITFAARFEALDPTPDPSCLRAVGMLRLFDRGFEDMARARDDLERYLATGASGSDADEARAMLARLGAHWSSRERAAASGK